MVRNQKTSGRAQAGEVYIGRPGKWGNPFSIGKDGNREEVLKKYQQWMYGLLELPGRAPPTRAEVAELKGKTLVCWCHPLKCHGDLLEIWAERYG